VCAHFDSVVRDALYEQDIVDLLGKGRSGVAGALRREVFKGMVIGSVLTGTRRRVGQPLG
jgi:hypothetical protein